MTISKLSKLNYLVHFIKFTSIIMIFKIIIVGGLAFYLYRMLTVPKINGRKDQDKINNNDNDDYVEYEEVE